MKTVKDAYDVFRSGLKDTYSNSETDAITSLVLTDITGLNKASLKAFTGTELNVVQSEKLLTIIAQLKTGMPVQYILGYTDFYGLTFRVDPSVLIPRPETEELVEWILRTIPLNNTQNILDIGTGSGCIPITLKHNIPDSNLFGIDISSIALQTAKHNAEVNKVNVTFIKADALNLNEPVIASQRYGVVVSNPPYVTMTDKQQMHHNVTDFEPHTALFVTDQNPLIFYKAIADFATRHLINGGYLFFEINESLGLETVEILNHKGFQNIELRKDMSGKDRMIKAKWLE